MDSAHVNDGNYDTKEMTLVIPRKGSVGFLGVKTDGTPGNICLSDALAVGYSADDGSVVVTFGQVPIGEIGFNSNTRTEIPIDNIDYMVHFTGTEIENPIMEKYNKYIQESR